MKHKYLSNNHFGDNLGETTYQTILLGSACDSLEMYYLVTHSRHNYINKTLHSNQEYIHTNTVHWKYYLTIPYRIKNAFDLGNWMFLFKGGIKAVVWTDAVQTFAMFGAMLLVIFKATADVGGLQEVIRKNIETQRVEGPE